MILPLLLLLQGSPTTIGDTVYIERAVGNVGGALVRPQAWQLGPVGRELGPAEVRWDERGAVVRYAIVLWYPGEHRLTIPGPVLVRRDGRSDTLAASTARVRIESVLPANQRRSSLAPKPAIRAVPLAAETPLYAIILLGLAGIGVGITAYRWRRRGRVPPRRLRRPAAPTPELLERWTAEGEYRAALHAWSRMIGRRLARAQGAAESAELTRLQEEIKASGYDSNGSERLAELTVRAARMGGA
jgi:hypothetical protein